MALAGAFVFAIATEGGRYSRDVRPMWETFDRIAESAGLALTEIRLTGHVQTQDKAVFDALQLTQVHSLLGFDAQAARQRIEQLPWVRTATIQRSFPDTISVAIAERVPFALWEHDGRRHLIDETGRLLGPAPAIAELPIVTGAGANTTAAQLLSQIAEHPHLASRVARAHRIEDRRWTLVLDAGLAVHLPAEDENEALWRLTMARPGGALVDRGLAVIDLRSPSLVVITPAAIAPVAGMGPAGRVAVGVPRGGGPETRSE